MRRGFTLIELLTVIAVIAVLAAILFPVFSQAKRAAKSAACLTQARQMGTAFELYLADSDGVFPGAADGVQGERVEGGWIYYDVFGSERPGHYVLEKGGLFPYVKEKRIYSCPACPGGGGQLSYAINSCLTERMTPSFNRGKSSSVVPETSSIMLIGEEEVEGSVSTNDGFFNVEVDHFAEWHGGLTQVVFADLHAKAVKARDRMPEILMGGTAACP